MHSSLLFRRFLLLLLSESRSLLEDTTPGSRVTEKASRELGEREKAELSEREEINN